MDELELQLASNRFVRDCCEMIITETWLHTLIPNAAVQLSGRTIHRQDRNKDSGRRYRSLRAKTARLQNSFFPVATRTLNSMH
ncbi:uncharacterized protein LOC122764210 isoform X1 [Tachysurus ichikawai]